MFLPSSQFSPVSLLPLPHVQSVAQILEVSPSAGSQLPLSLHNFGSPVVTSVVAPGESVVSLHL